MNIHNRIKRFQCIEGIAVWVIEGHPQVHHQTWTLILQNRSHYRHERDCPCVTGDTLCNRHGSEVWLSQSQVLYSSAYRSRAWRDRTTSSSAHHVGFEGLPKFSPVVGCLITQSYSDHHLPSLECFTYLVEFPSGVRITGSCWWRPIHWMLSFMCSVIWDYFDLWSSCSDSDCVSRPRYRFKMYCLFSTFGVFWRTLHARFTTICKIATLHYFC